jgi:hypothetical protein
VGCWKSVKYSQKGVAKTPVRGDFRWAADVVRMVQLRDEPLIQPAGKHRCD